MFSSPPRNHNICIFSQWKNYRALFYFRGEIIKCILYIKILLLCIMYNEKWPSKTTTYKVVDNQQQNINWNVLDVFELSIQVSSFVHLKQQNKLFVFLNYLWPFTYTQLTTVSLSRLAFNLDIRFCACRTQQPFFSGVFIPLWYNV